MKYWMLTPLSNKRYWKIYFQCDCGNIKDIFYNNVVSWRTQSCWCIRRLNIEDYINKKNWKLSIITYYEKEKHIYVEAKCDCWTKISNLYLWIYKNMRTCWCSHKDPKKHWMTCNWRHRLYRIWIWIKSRTERMNDQWYKYYWWRWICNNWKTFKEFKEDMYESYIKHVEEYGEKDTTIDRIDNDWDYCKYNCKRSTIKQQANNRSNSIKNKLWLAK